MTTEASKRRPKQCRSGEKGTVGEREVADLFAKVFTAPAWIITRKSQSRGGGYGADVEVARRGHTDRPYLWVEAKWRQREEVRAWVAKVGADARVGSVPILFTRPNKARWIAAMFCEDLFGIFEELLEAQAEIETLRAQLVAEVKP